MVLSNSQWQGFVISELERKGGILNVDFENKQTSILLSSLVAVIRFSLNKENPRLLSKSVKELGLARQELRDLRSIGKVAEKSEKFSKEVTTFIIRRAMSAGYNMAPTSPDPKIEAYARAIIAASKEVYGIWLKHKENIPPPSDDKKRRRGKTEEEKEKKKGEKQHDKALLAGVIQGRKGSAITTTYPGLVRLAFVYHASDGKDYVIDPFNTKEQVWAWWKNHYPEFYEFIAETKDYWKEVLTDARNRFTITVPIPDKEKCNYELKGRANINGKEVEGKSGIIDLHTFDVQKDVIIWVADDEWHQEGIRSEDIKETDITKIYPDGYPNLVHGDMRKIGRMKDGDWKDLEKQHKPRA